MNVSPITALNETPKAELISLLHEKKILHIPIVDDKNRVIGLETLGRIIPT